MKKLLLTLAALSDILIFSLNLLWATSVPAFPGAEGFGAKTPGGRGGRVIEVTNLNDSGAGSLRAAIEATGPRIVVFRTGGTITLATHIVISSPFITIAGQTAPGDGVQVRGGGLKIETHDVVLRYLKLRPGDLLGSPKSTGLDGLYFNGVRGKETCNVIVDHCSVVWGSDTGGISMSVDVHDVTVQNSINGEGLYLSHHNEGVPPKGHSKGIVISDLQGDYGRGHPTRITLFRNLFTTSDDRNPSLQQVESAEMVNNVIYNWGKHAGFGNVFSLNLIKNFFIKGPETTHLVAWKPTVKSGEVLHTSAVFEQGNLTEGFSTVRGSPDSVYASATLSPYSLSSLEVDPQQAYNEIVASVGATLPVRDSVDQRIINNLKNRSGNFLNGVGSPAPTISWPSLAAGTPPVDSDHDGMPDDWELSHGLNPKNAEDRNSTAPSGYTYVEEYFNGLIVTLRISKPSTVTFEEIRTGGSTSSTAVATSANLTGVMGQLYLAAISTNPNASVTGVSGLGLSWTLMKAQCSGQNTTGVEVWRALGKPSSNGLVTANLSAVPNNAVIAVSRYSGVSGVNPIGNIVSGNTNGSNGACSGGVDSSSYSFNLATAVGGAVAYGAAAMQDMVHAPGAGFTDRVKAQQGSSSVASLAVEDKSAALASAIPVDGSFSGNVDWALIGLEIEPSNADTAPAIDSFNPIRFRRADDSYHTGRGNDSQDQRHQRKRHRPKRPPIPW
jgi:hypothetical protein